MCASLEFASSMSVSKTSSYNKAVHTGMHSRNGTVGMFTVSYTHLDVYKRQMANISYVMLSYSLLTYLYTVLSVIYV